MSGAEPDRSQQLLEAVVAIGSGLDLRTTLHRIVELATDLVDARYGALGVLDPAGERLAEFLTVGIDDEARRSIGHLPEGHGILGVLILDARPLRLSDLSRHPESAGFPPNHPPMTSFLGAPILVRGRVFGNLYLTEKTTGPEFTATDEQLVMGLASAAGTAIENARLHEQVTDLALAEDRQRIARDLHDTVIQRLFATGLSLQGVTPLLERDPAAASERIDRAVTELDETVRAIRTTIFALEERERANRGLRSRVLAVCESAIESLGFAPRVTFDGVLDARVMDEVSDDVVATVQEALSNVARHARARSATVDLRATECSVDLTIVDDGIGPESAGASDLHGHGLRNLEDRARRHGGTFSLRRHDGGGASLSWSIPIGPG
jgi:signal transduction histidine kinase